MGAKGKSKCVQRGRHVCKGVQIPRGKAGVAGKGKARQVRGKGQGVCARVCGQRARRKGKVRVCSVQIWCVSRQRGSGRQAGKSACRQVGPSEGQGVQGGKVKVAGRQGAGR